MAGNAKSSADIKGPQVLQGGRLPCLPPAWLWVCWEQHKQPDTLGTPSEFLSIFFQPGFAPLSPHQSRSWKQGLNREEDFPVVQAALAQHWQQMSKGRLEQVVPGQLARGTDGCTKGCESTLGVQGTSQIRTFKGLPSLQSAISFKGEDTHHLEVVLGMKSFLLVWFYEAAPWKISEAKCVLSSEKRSSSVSKIFLY